ncbi:protein VAC14 homolog [Styela clava]|uniref:protein VAC14 homolog n=1 Tax=Styela clava TaxID=7725 RepID=UPI001939E265|nr:protein VAC14 homolog [Styela clava]
MANNDPNYPLTTTIVRLLHDKLYEKRKIAALEIEKIIRALVLERRNDDVKKAITLLTSDFTLSNNSNSRKGGLIGLAACAIALGSQDITQYLDELINPVLICSMDADNRIRYFACESLYNIVKVSRADTMPFFNKLFDAMSKLTADPDPNVRNGSDLLDRLLKDIVTEFPAFDVAGFMPLLCDRIYTMNQYTRRFLIQWLICLDSVPEINILIYLPKFLDGMFQILGDTSMEIKKMCETTLDEILQNIKKDPESVKFNEMVNIVIVHCQSQDDFIKVKALLWMQEFIKLAGPIVLQYASGVVGAVLPTLAYEDLMHNSVHEAAKSANSSLMKLIDNSCDKSEGSSGEDSPLPLNDMFQVFTRYLQHQSTSTKTAVIRWITHLLVQIPYRTFMYIDEIFTHLMNTLADSSDHVVLLALECLAELASSAAGTPMTGSTGNTSSSTTLVLNEYFRRLMVFLLNMFKTDKQFMENRSSFVVRQLSLLLNAENVYRVFAEILLKQEDDCKFASLIVQIFNIILMTSSELFELRNQLKKGDSKDSSQLFCCLYKSWCHNPVATVSLCLLTQNYKHGCDLLMKFADLEVTVDFLTEVDKLIQLLESPIFTYLRLQLLDVESNQHLVKCMYALLMLLPQSRSFEILQHRLSCLPTPQLVSHLSSKEVKNNKKKDIPTVTGNSSPDVDFDQLFKHFVSIQEQHIAYKKQKRLKASNSTTDAV